MHNYRPEAARLYRNTGFKSCGFFLLKNSFFNETNLIFNVYIAWDQDVVAARKQSGNLLRYCKTCRNGCLCEIFVLGDMRHAGPVVVVGQKYIQNHPEIKTFNKFVFAIRLVAASQERQNVVNNVEF